MGLWSLVPSGRTVGVALDATPLVARHRSGDVNVFFEEKNVGSGYRMSSSRSESARNSDRILPFAVGASDPGGAVEVAEHDVIDFWVL